MQKTAISNTLVQKAISSRFKILEEFARKKGLLNKLRLRGKIKKTNRQISNIAQLRRAILRPQTRMALLDKMQMDWENSRLRDRALSQLLKKSVHMGVIA